jgi:hypothetical protein
MDRRGWHDVAQMLDVQLGLRRIGPGDMLPGDLGLYQPEDGPGGIVLFLDRRRLCGWLGGEGSEFSITEAWECPLPTAWRV